jgi:hypothetical protein
MKRLLILLLFPLFAFAQNEAPPRNFLSVGLAGGIWIRSTGDFSV